MRSAWRRGDPGSGRPGPIPCNKLGAPFGVHGSLKTSENSTQLRDIPRTIAEAVASPAPYEGVSVFRAREPRSRSYLHYVWQHRYWDDPHLSPLLEFVIEGPVRDVASWHLKPERLVPAPSPMQPRLHFDRNRLNRPEYRSRRYIV